MRGVRSGWVGAGAVVGAVIFPLAAPTSQWFAQQGIDFAPASTCLNVRTIRRTK